MVLHKNIAFFGGIHGVGKTTVCKEICKKLRFIYLSASEVIKWEDSSYKKVANIEITQSTLTQNLIKIIDNESSYVLDGHLCLINKEGMYEPIPLKTFTEINPFCINVVTGNISQIQQRLEARDNKRYDANFLTDMQNAELGHAKYVAEALKVPLNVITQENYLEISQNIREQILKK